MPAARSDRRGPRTRLGRAGTWIAFLLAVSSCTQPPARGGDDEILLLCEPPFSSSTLPPLCSDAILWFTPEESRFRLRVADASRADHSPRDKNVIVVAACDAPGTWSRALRDRISKVDVARVEARGAGWFVWRDVWAAGQEVHLLLARTQSDLDSLLLQSGSDLCRSLEQSALARAEVRLQPHALNSTAQVCVRRHGFRLAFPPAYSADFDLAPPYLVEMAAPDPTRTIAVFRLDDVDAARLGDREYLLAVQRHALGSLHGDILLEPGATQWVPAGPEGRIVLRGMWRNVEDVGGGPLVTHFVYDAARRRLYAAQAQLFAPGRRKQPFLVELEAVLQTLRLEGSP